MDARKLTSKCQVTIPADVRRVLGLAAGDRVVFSTSGDTVTLHRAGDADDWSRAALAQMVEWDTPEDDEAFRDL